MGVGDASASPTAALLLNVLQESMGRIATILFAHKLGTALEPECKMYRLAADIFNDTAMVLDCLSPAFPKTARVLILSFSSVLRSLCGVCAGSAKASLSAHFAKRGNLGELNAVSTYTCYYALLLLLLERSCVRLCLAKLYCVQLSIGVCVDERYIGVVRALHLGVLYHTCATTYEDKLDANLIGRKTRAKRLLYRC